MSFAFASVAKLPTKVRRNRAGSGAPGPESNNDTLCSLRHCDGCGTSFRPKDRSRRFCCHRCYADSLIQPIADRLWKRVHKTRTCWNWMGALTGAGGHWEIAWKGRPQYVHRVVWELTHGPIPRGKQINHHCDNARCVRPEHLYLGTQDDNMKDAARRGRLTVPRTCTLSIRDRLDIHSAPAYRGICRDLADKYGVTKSCISLIRRGRFLGSGVWFGTKDREAALCDFAEHILSGFPPARES